MEPVTKIESVSFPNSEEISAEVKAPMEAVAESELLPPLTKEDVPIGMEPPTAVSMKDSFQFPIHNKEDLKDDTVALAVPEQYQPDIEKIRAEETRVKDIAQKEIDISKYKNAERNATIEDLTNNKLTINSVANGETVNSADKEETLIVPKVEKEEQEVISNQVERNEKKEKDIPTEIREEEIIVENEKASEVLPVTEIEEFVEEVEKSKEIPLDESTVTDVKETIPHTEIIKTNEIVEVPPVPEIEEIEPEKIMEVTEIKGIIPEALSPTVDIIEVEKLEPDEFSIVDVEAAPIANAVEEKIKIEEPTPILNAKEESLLLNAEEKIEIKEPVLIKEEIKVVESSLITDIQKEQIEVTELPPIEDVTKKEDIEAVALPPILDVAKDEKIEAAESPLITDVTKNEKIKVTELSIEDVEKKEKIEAVTLPTITDVVKEEKIEAEELLSFADEAEEMIEMIQPIPTLPTIKREEEIEAAEESVLKEIKEKKDEEMEEEVKLPDVTSIELPEKKKEEEIPPEKKKKILIPPSKKPTLKDKKEEIGRAHV